MSKQIEAMKLAREWIGEAPERRTVSAGKMVAILTEALAEQPEQPMIVDYEALWKQMCERCDILDAKLAEYEKKDIK